MTQHKSENRLCDIRREKELMTVQSGIDLGIGIFLTQLI